MWISIKIGATLHLGIGAALDYSCFITAAVNIVEKYLNIMMWISLFQIIVKILSKVLQFVSGNVFEKKDK